jgi:nitrogen fixation protein NifB
MSEESYPVANVRGQEVPYDPEQLRRISEHPCFSEKACHSFGRMHLAVAPKCNIQCKYCIRDFDCVNESRPGVTSQVLKPKEALERVDQVLEKYHYIKVVAVAGPGEPLFNEETFENPAHGGREVSQHHSLPKHQRSAPAR